MTTRQELFNFFTLHGIDYETFEHEPAFTVAESLNIVADIPGGHTKNLFLKDDHKQFWLISALQDTQIRLKEVGKKLDAKGLRFAQPEFLREYLGVEPGSVTWFALINDREKQVKAILDKKIFEHDHIAFHPLKNDATTVIASEDLKKFTNALGHLYRVFDFS